ncbi:hypothetical protein HDU97_004528 [Phlyctochytrium planicorne]|nr:hypothetical protein HDU97_004528 [Phlyctochytrium planicorne]
MDSYMLGGAPSGENSFGQPQPPSGMSISGPLSLGGGYIAPPPQMQRRGTNFNLPSSPVTPTSTQAPPSPFGNHQRRPSGSDGLMAPPPSLVPPVPVLPPSSGGPVVEVGLPTQINRPQGGVKSLFQACMTLIEKLYGFPLFEFYLFPDGTAMYQTDPPPLIDPVAILWGCFRLGAPLCILYNQLNPRSPLNVNDVSSIRPPKYTNICKDNVYHFIVACKRELDISEKDVFSISELYKDDTNGFVKVLKTVDLVMERIESRGLLPPKRNLPFNVPTQDAEAPTDNRSKLINELIDTERKYINDLEVIQNYKKEALHQNLLSKDDVHTLFGNLDELLDFQRRFLIAMESTLSLPANEQRIGQLFNLNEDYFAVYHSFCANYQFATNFALQETERLNRLAHLIPPNMLQSYLIKPVQRVCRYPLLLQELVKLSQNTSYPLLDELNEGLEAIKRVTEKVNEQKRVEENRQMKNDLGRMVEDWKGLQIDDFGELILSDKFFMISNDVEKEFNLYLFERILLCCKDLTKSKKKSKKTVDKDGPTFALKGNIYVNSISRVQDNSDPTIGFFGVKVFWKDVNEVENFALKCRNEEQVKLWKDRLERQIEAEIIRKQRNNSVDMPNQLSMMQNIQGSVDDYPDSGYASVYRPSFDSILSSQASGIQQYHSPPLARSRSIPHNYYPMQYASPQPMPGSVAVSSSSSSSANTQRKSQSPVTRGFGSQSDLPAASFYHANAPRSLSTSPDATAYPRSTSPAPPVPQFRYPMTTNQPPMPMHYVRNGSGQAGVNLPPPPVRTYSTTKTGGTIYSDDDLSEDELMYAQRGYQQQRKPSVAQYFTTPESLQQYAQLPQAQNPRAAMAGVTAINTARKMSVPSEDERSASSLYSSARHYSPVNHPPVPPIPQGYQGPGVPLKRTASGPEDVLGIMGNHPTQGYSRTAGVRSAVSPAFPDPQGYITSRSMSYGHLNQVPPLATPPPTPESYSSQRQTADYNSAQMSSAFAQLSTRDPGNSSNSNPSPQQAATSSSPGFVRVRIHYETEKFFIAIPFRGTTFTEMQQRIERKIRLTGGKTPSDLGRKIRIRYKDDEGDMIALNADEDVKLAFDGARRAATSRDNIMLEVYVQ